jgi:hypothetical protein
MKKTKTWKLGEYAKGGVISVEVNKTFRYGNVITIIGKEWDYSKGTNKNSNQNNAKEFIRSIILSNDSEAERKMFFFLTDLTTAYYADNVIQWIKSKIKIN